MPIDRRLLQAAEKGSIAALLQKSQTLAYEEYASVLSSSCALHLNHSWLSDQTWFGGLLNTNATRDYNAN